MNGMYASFETDKKLEREGIVIDYGKFRVLIAAANETNKRFSKYAEAKLKPIRRQIELQTADSAEMNRIMYDIYAQTIILGWEVKQEDELEGDHWVTGIEAPDGSILEFNKENILATFEKLPRLFSDIQGQATSMSNFLKANSEEDSKN